MQEVFEKIIKRLESKYTEAACKKSEPCDYPETIGCCYDKAINKAVEIVKQAAAEYNNGWIPCSEKMPPVETEVFILAKRKLRNGDYVYIRTTAMYEDGTVSEYDSCWNWEDIDGEYDEENDCYIVPEGWWEQRHYNPDGVYNNEVDDEVIAWQPLPENNRRESETESETEINQGGATGCL